MAVGVAVAEHELSFGVILLGGFAIPQQRFRFILRHPKATGVAEAEHELSQRVILLGGFAIPPRRLGFIFRHDAEIELSHGVILLSGFAIPLRRLCHILRHAFPTGVAEAEIELSHRIAWLQLNSPPQVEFTCLRTFKGQGPDGGLPSLELCSNPERSCYQEY